jgi:aspartate aminotransferase-like enzyme
MEGKVSLEERFKMHRETSVKFKTAMKDMGFKLVSRLCFVQLDQ